MANKLNMAIAKTHRLSSRVIGMQLTGGNFIGIALSAVQMSAGFLIIGQPIIAGSWFLYGLIALIGVALAVLIERLSLGGLSAVRVAMERKRRLEDWYFALETPTEQQTRLYDQRKGDLGRDIGTGWAFGGIGMVLSTGIGDVFWHHLFEPLKPEWLGVTLSLACAGVIGLTFIHSELYKALVDGVLKEILADMHLLKVAVAVEGENMQLDMMVDAYDAVRENKEVRRPAEEKMESVIARRLTGFARQAQNVADQVAAANGGTVINGEVEYLPTNGQLALPAPKGRYYEHKAELLRMVRSNPALSQGDIARHFGVAKSTANSWYRKLRAGL